MASTLANDRNQPLGALSSFANGLLNRLRDHLTDCIGCGCLSLDTRVLSNPDDKFGERRAGSRLMAEGR